MENVIEECLICFEIINKEDRFVTKCSHIFHTECLMKSIDSSKDKKNCPYCRQTCFRKSFLNKKDNLSNKNEMINFKTGDLVYVNSTKIKGATGKIEKITPKFVWIKFNQENHDIPESLVKKTNIQLIN